MDAEVGFIGGGQYGAKISNGFAASENLDDEGVDISKALESIRQNIKAPATENLGYYELKQYKPWFDECPKLLDQRK
jgi:hypothetical protein